jgi:hypothetical protein
MRWRKLGVLVGAPPPVRWAVSHASVPIVDRPGDGSPRLLFSSRDANGRSLVGGASLDLTAGRVHGYDERPLLEPGELGAFDDSGAMASCLVRDDESQLLYYIGWSLGVRVPFYTFVGCAISQDEGRTFTRVSRAPILPRSSVDPFLTTAPWVMRDGRRWRMWYASGTGWEETNEGPLHRYHIKYAESDDGVDWRRDGDVCIDYADGSEYAITRPCVVRDGDCYRMWYSRRGSTYRIGYAESSDAIKWTRKDEEAGIDVSSEGWDAEMIEYPFVCDEGEQRYLLYNGNGYGATGIGWAVLES